MHGVPKFVLERLKRKPMADPQDRHSAIDNQESTIEDRRFPHPDANLLAAFVEKTLPERERAQVLNHLAQCADCRELVALTLPAEAEVTVPTRLPARRGWSLWQVLRWGTLAAALGAVAIGVVLHRYPRNRQEKVSKDMRSNIVASASKAARPLSVELSARGSPKAPVAKGRTEPRESPRETAMLGKGAAPPRGPQIAAQPAGAELSRQVTLIATAPPTPPTAGAGPVRAKAESVTVVGGLDTGLAGGVSAPSNTLSGPLAPAPMSAESQRARLSSMAFRAERAGPVARPGALWTISPDGKLQRSDDGGKTWEEAPIDDKVTFRAIQALGRDVWAGGSGGALYHSNDGGATWTRVNLTSGGTPTTEIIVSIIASSPDLQHITVTTAAGERWTTEDSGRHWKKEAR